MTSNHSYFISLLIKTDVIIRWWVYFLEKVSSYIPGIVTWEDDENPGIDAFLVGWIADAWTEITNIIHQYPGNIQGIIGFYAVLNSILTAI